MSWEAWITLGMLGVIFTCMAFTRIGPDVLLCGALTLLLTLGIVTPAEALAGLSNEGMVTVAVLFVVAAGLRETGGMHLITQRLLGHPRSAMAAQVRLMFPVAVLSAFLNNTPLVAMLLPVVSDWSRQLRLSASKLMIPLSYATILGGTCSLIGTSTNLVVNGLLKKPSICLACIYSIPSGWGCHVPWLAWAIQCSPIAGCSQSADRSSTLPKILGNIP